MYTDNQINKVGTRFKGWDIEAQGGWSVWRLFCISMHFFAFRYISPSSSPPSSLHRPSKTEKVERHWTAGMNVIRLPSCGQYYLLRRLIQNC